MNRRFTNLALLAVLLTAGSAATAQTTRPVTSSVDAATQTKPAELTAAAKLIEAIAAADDPSAVVTAFANALAVDKKNIAVYEAYVQKMADLGFPELASKQAQLLVTLDPASGIGWAVLSFNQAKDGDVPRAMSNTLLAVQLKPMDPFVLRTAAQLYAFYDTVDKKPDLGERATTKMEQLRKKLLADKIFKETYDGTVAAYRAAKPAAGGAAANAPAANQPQAVNQAQAVDAGVGGLYTGGYYSPFWYGGGWPYSGWGGGCGPWYHPQGPNLIWNVNNGQVTPLGAGDTIVFDQAGQPSGVVRGPSNSSAVTPPPVQCGTANVGNNSRRRALVVGGENGRGAASLTMTPTPGGAPAANAGISRTATVSGGQPVIRTTVSSTPPAPVEIAPPTVPSIIVSPEINIGGGGRPPHRR